MRNRDSDVLVLNEGIEFENATSTATESQLSQNKEINTRAVLTYFGLPSNFLTNANSDSYKTAVMIAVLPIVAQLENALNEYLLLESEKGTLKFVIDTTSLMRTNIVERYNAYKVGVDSGVLTIDEVRRLESLPVLDLPFVKMSLGNVLYNTENGNIFVPNTGVTTDMQGNTTNSEEAQN